MNQKWVHQRNKLCRFYIACLKIIYRLLLRLELVDIENIPANGPAIIAINHLSFLDPVLLSSVPQRKIISMSKIENLSQPILGSLLHTFDAFPVHRGGVDRQALSTAAQVLQVGGLLLLAPEGTRSRTGKLRRARNGLALIASQTQAPIVPVGFSGSNQFKHNIRKLKRSHIRIVFGKPFYLQSSTERPGKEELSAMSQEIMYQIAALLPAEQRGVYADMSQASQTYLKFIDG